MNVCAYCLSSGEVDCTYSIAVSGKQKRRVRGGGKVLGVCVCYEASLNPRLHWRGMEEEEEEKQLQLWKYSACSLA